MSKKKPQRTAAKRTARILKLKSGREYEITGENGRFYICEGTAFSKSHPDIALIEQRKVDREAITKER